MELVYDAFEVLKDDRLALEDNAEWYIFEVPAFSKRTATLGIAKGEDYRSGDEFQIDLRLEDGILYPAGSFKLN